MVTALCLYAELVLAVDSQVFPSLLTRIGNTSMQQGLLLSSFFLLFPLSSAVSGLLADRFGKKTVLVVGGILLALPFAVYASAEMLLIRALVFLMFGLGMGTLEGQATALLTDIHPGRERAVVNLSQLFFSIGAAGGPAVIALVFRLFPDLPLKWLFWAIGAVALSVSAGFLLMRSEKTGTASFVRGGFRQVLTDPLGRMLLLAMFCYVAAEMGTAGWLAKYAELYLFFPNATAPLALTLFWAGLGLSRAVAGVHFHGVRDTHFLVAALLFTLGTRIAAFLIRRPLPCMVLFFFLGTGMGTVWPTLVAMIGARFKRTSGSDW
jgi:fucose permease